MNTTKTVSAKKTQGDKPEFLSILKKSLSIIMLSAIGAGAVMYSCLNCPKKEAKFKAEISKSVANYIDNNSATILEQIAKTDNFGSTVRAFSPTSDEEINSAIKNFIQNNPNILDEYIRANADFIANTIKETEAFKNVASTINEEENTTQEPVSDENQKYKDSWDKIANSEVSPYVGPKDAKVTVVEFFDFACGHCKALAPVIAELIKRNPDVKFVFNPLYFMSDASPYAAKVSLASFKKDKFLPVFEGIMTLPSMTEETINQILIDEGLNVDEIKKMIDEKTIRRGVQDIDALSQVLGINGVPMILINGEAFYGRSIEEFQYKINSLK